MELLIIIVGCVGPVMILGIVCTILANREDKRERENQQNALPAAGR